MLFFGLFTNWLVIFETSFWVVVEFGFLVISDEKKCDVY